MTKYNNSGYKSENRRKPRVNRNSGRRSGPIRNSGRSDVPTKKFDPSLFIKKVEEQKISPIYIPKNNFSDFLIEEQIKKNIISKGYTLPTPIQDEVIPLILQG